jgi:hypothetical protein
MEETANALPEEEPPPSQPLTWVPPGHFYSPLVDPTNRHVRRILNDFPSSNLAPESALQINDSAILDTFARIVRFSGQMPFQAEPIAGLRFHLRNPAFSFGDASAYFGILMDRRPRRVIEIGSGYSSCLLMDTNELFFGGSIHITMIEPYPEVLESLIQKSDPYWENLLVSDLQDVPTEKFQELQANDILFIDSSHIGKMGSDVNDYLFRILPILNSGVLIHIHDIPYPFEYQSQWIDKENRSWNEAYLLRAFLQYNHAFEIIYFSHYMVRRHEDLILEQLPEIMRNGGASIWLEKVSGNSMASQAARYARAISRWSRRAVSRARSRWL